MHPCAHAQVCYRGHVIHPDATPPPDGWFPTVPFREGRLWRGSRISPFGANMAVVLYRAKGAAPG